VGGGNSAGQAALFLGSTCSEVHIVIRGGTLASSMSRYLIDQIERMPNISVLPHTRSPLSWATTGWIPWN
jgi:thioredoxin reductase (NADPH)